MNKRNLFLGLAIAGSLVLAPFATATAAPVAAGSASVSVSVTQLPTAKAKVFKNCKALNKVYKGGVAKAGVKYNKVSGKNRAFKVKPKSSTALYKANKKLDRDKDGIACEK